MTQVLSEGRIYTALRLVLRIVGTSTLLALIFVGAPEAWMVAIHTRLEMGALPDAPVVGYLARSTSAFYAMWGGLLWVISFDLDRHRVVIRYLAWTLGLFGIVLLGVDWTEGMPWSWTLSEGPLVVATGGVVWWLENQLPDHAK